MERVAAIWYRQLTRGDFFHIERRREAGSESGGGQTYIDIPATVRKALFDFLGEKEPSDNKWPLLTRDVDTIGAPGTVSPLRFGINRQGETPRYRILRQVRQRASSERHPAWTDQFGFPRAPDTVASPGEAETYLPAGGARVFLARTVEGKLYAGHTAGSSLPPAWPSGYRLEELFDPARPGGLIAFNGAVLLLDAANASAPFVADTAWSAEETAVLLDVYVDQGPEPGADALDAAREQINAIAGQERTSAAVEEKLREIEALDPTSDSQAPIYGATEEVWDRFGGDADALRVAVKEIAEGPAVDLDATAGDAVVQKTSVESATVAQYRTRGTAGTIAERREHRLVLQYQAHLEAIGHDASAHTYLLPGYPLPLLFDLFDEL
jgi:hypothetical protein